VYIKTGSSLICSVHSIKQQLFSYIMQFTCTTVPTFQHHPPVDPRATLCHVPFSSLKPGVWCRSVLMSNCPQDMHFERVPATSSTWTQRGNLFREMPRLRYPRRHPNSLRDCQRRRPEPDTGKGVRDEVLSRARRRWRPAARSSGAAGVRFIRTRQFLSRRVGTVAGRCGLFECG
jgi:hypothetical protein